MEEFELTRIAILLGLVACQSFVDALLVLFVSGHERPWITTHGVRLEKLSTTRSLKQKRSREISLREPSVIERLASEPFFILMDSAAVSSTSIGLTSVVPNENISAQAPCT
jgi:hypothetical protein